MTNRLPYIDFASGVMILWMILFHAIAHAWGSFYPCVKIPCLHFFMPWFFYKSGQFFKKCTFRELFVKDSNKLLKTFAIWSIIGALCYLLVCLINDSFTYKNFAQTIIHEFIYLGKMPLNTPLWFLLTLLMVRVVANAVLPDRGGRFAKIKIASIIVLGYMFSYLIYRHNSDQLPYWIGNGVAGLCFFVLGYAFRDLEKSLWLILPCVMVYVVGCFIGFPMVDMFPNKLVTGNYLLWIPVSFCCIVCFNAFCRWLYKYIRLKPIEIVGQNAMTILVIHVLLVKMTMELLRYNHIHLSSYWVLCLILLEYVLILPLCCWIKQKYNYKLAK